MLINTFKTQLLIYALPILISTSVFSQTQTGRNRISVNDSIYYESVKGDNKKSSYTRPITYIPPTFHTTVVEADQNTFNILGKTFKQFQLIYLNTDSLNKFVKSNYFSLFNLEINGKKYLLEIQENDLRSSKYKSVVHYDFGVVEKEKDFSQKVNQYKGFANGDRENMVRMTISSKEVLARISLQREGTTLYIEPLNDFLQNIETKDPRTNENRTNLFVVYEPEDVVPTIIGTCETVEGTGTTTKDNIPISEIVGPDPPIDIETLCTPLTLEIATEADYELWQKYQNLENDRILSVLNLVEGVYSASFNLVFAVVFQRSWATPNDPYASTSAVNAFYEVKGYWNTNCSNINRDIVSFFSGKQFNTPAVGATQSIVICNWPSRSYNVTQNMENINTVSNITAHEIGHNFSAHHDDSENDNNYYRRSIMCALVENVDYYVSTQEKNKISNHINTFYSCLLNNTSFNPNYSYSPWVTTWDNDRNLTRLGTWNFSIGDYILTGNFDVLSDEELLFINNNTSWATIMQYSCGRGGSDWYHLWSNMGNGTIGSWVMSQGDKHYVGDFNGDGKSDLLSISPNNNWATLQTFSTMNNGSFQFLWSNMGNRFINTWYVNSSDQFVVGDFDNDNKDELLCISNNGNGYSTLLDFNNNQFQHKWSNLGNGSIQGFNISNANHYRKGDFHNLGYDELALISNSWAAFLRYNSNTNGWDWVWSNNGSGNMADWGLPLANSSDLYDYVLPGNLDFDGYEELFLIESGSNATNAATMQFNPFLNRNWIYFDGWIGPWNQSGSCNYFLCKNIASQPTQLLAVKAIPQGGGAYLYQAGMQRIRSDNYNFRAGQSHEEDETTNTPSSNTFYRNQEPFKLYPNPNNGNFTLEKNSTDPCSITIYNTLGEILFKKENIRENIANIDISNFPKGVYFLKYNDSSTEKIVNFCFQ